ncbi:Flagellar basal-body rod protein FlgG [Caprobacter fermentans]|uniref:Flagellar basal-body rod protein FlgG n=1 Tax=Caproicibacter fermentans TaxID=2576756 RepID=A0A6N8HVY2_9FIRM|nr:flagellar hook-basal body protein [Caproicibacter fermentans]MVB09755.1 Flagellar basal-body rod protein FlgG [Caproicibacter fermentans]OCN03160.1 flagellar biosynthesis protein FlgF [Clostridium sp. W14A]QNK42362.1 flagellar hook-basal body protein [Caproicibacter fermentans]
MVRGFYMLGSGILTQSRVLNTISNNVANADTNGFKKSRVMEKTFGSMVVERVDRNRTPVGSASLMNTADEAVTDYSQGTVNQTGRKLDFAIKGDGFFAVQGDNGTVYTRNGSFNIDGDGYLVLKGQGRVLGSDGNPIRPGTDEISSDGQGYLTANGASVGQLAVYRFPDNAELKTVGEGLFQGTNAGLVTTPAVLWKSLEGSNVDMTEEMTNALSSQRELQSCSQALKMYDTVLDQAVDIAKL